LDSVVLLHLLVEAKLHVHLLHVNYHLRGEDSNADEKLVRKLAERNKIHLDVLDFPMKAHLAEQGGNLQNEARKIRYSFFQEQLAKEPNSLLFTAHHFDDQMETFFMHLSRKSGLVGLSCMAEKNGPHWRPLLSFTKPQLLAIALENQLEWREDVSNQDNKYLRNLWRNDWLPLLKNEIPSLEESVALLIQTFQTERATLENQFLPKAAEIQEKHRWDFADFDTCSEEGKYLITKAMGWRFSELKRLNELRLAGKSKFLEIHRLELEIWNNEDHFSIETTGEIIPPTFHTESISSLPSSFSKNEYFADPLKIKGKLKMRFWREGDRIASLGMRGTQLISDIIKDAKVPSSEKKKVLVLEDDEKILWCVGLKIGRLGMADGDSSEILKIRVEGK
jgi:tRNA(Ile)-lysidine synthase